MKTVSVSLLGAIVSGLLVYFLVRLLWPPIPVEAFTNVIGLAAILGAAGAAWWARRRARSRTSATPTPPLVSRSDRHDRQ